MRFISLFSGIGGFDLGFERAGMKCVAQVEKDEFCLKVLNKHWPNVLKFKDVRDVGKHNLPAADVIVGGFPCQPHSTAGKRKGSADDRDLWPQYYRIVEEFRPNWVVGENVPGIRTTILDQVLSDLESLDYSTVALDIPAAGFNAPHIRERIFIVAHAKSGAGRLSVPARQQEKELHIGRSGQTQPMADASSAGLSITTCPEFRGIQGQDETFSRGSVGGGNSEAEWWDWWAVEPDVGRVADGVPHRVDRLRGLGNAVVPQVAEWLGRRIMDAALGQEAE